jgi:hypothetical protein
MKEPPSAPTAEFQAKYLKGQTFKLMLVTNIAEGRKLQSWPDEYFTVAEAIFGEDVRVLWLADKDETFADDAARKVIGFPILLTEEGALGLDGALFEIRRV